jgi:hypothetical protein
MKSLLLVFLLALNLIAKPTKASNLYLDSIILKMKVHSDTLRNSMDYTKRKNANDSFLSYLKLFVENEESFLYPVDSIKTVMFLNSPDKKVQIITWLISDNSGFYKSYGLIRYQNKKEIINYWLRENIETNNKLALDVQYDETSWQGGLYYQIIPHKVKSKKCYVILAMHGMDPKINRKSIDVISFDKENIAFGLPIFYMSDNDYEPSSRCIFDFSDETTMTLRFETSKYIVFDNLEPASKILAGENKFLVPEGTYNYFKKTRKGRYYLKKDFDTKLLEK